MIHSECNMKLRGYIDFRESNKMEEKWITSINKYNNKIKSEN